MALNGLFCADVPLRNYSLTHPLLVGYLMLGDVNWMFKDDKLNGFVAGRSCQWTFVRPVSTRVICMDINHRLLITAALCNRLYWYLPQNDRLSQYPLPCQKHRNVVWNFSCGRKAFVNAVIRVTTSLELVSHSICHAHQLRSRINFAL